MILTQQTTLHERINRPINQIDDEIDLFGLAATLWRGKWLVMCVTLFCVALAVVYLWSIPQKYKIDFPVYAADSNQLLPLHISNHSKHLENGVSPLSAKALFRASMDKFDSTSVLKAFWLGESNPQEVGASPLVGERLTGLTRFVKSLKVVKKVENNEAMASISLEGEDPELMAAQLEALLLHVSDTSLSSAVKIYLTAVDASLQRIDGAMALVRQEAQVTIDDQISNVVEARKIAAALGIVNSEFDKLANIEVKLFENRLYLLGTKALDAELQALDARKDNDSFASGLRELQAAKAGLDSDRQRIISNIAQVKAFDYPDHVSVPLEPVSKKLLILIMSVFLGGMLGIVLVFVRQGIRGYQARSAAGQSMLAK